MVGFAESVTVFDADNKSWDLPVHPDGKYYDARGNADNVWNESLHLSHTSEQPVFMNAHSDIPMSDGTDPVKSFSALNNSAGDLWDGSFGSFASEGSASVSQFLGEQFPASAVAPMDNLMSLQDIPKLAAARNKDGSGLDASLGSSFNKSIAEDEAEEDPMFQVARQMGYALLLQGGMHFAIAPLMKLGKRLFRSENNEEDVVEDAAAAQTMVNRTSQIQHGVLNPGGEMSAFAQAGAHESSRNMTGTLGLQKDITAQVMKQAMIRAAQTAGTSVGQGSVSVAAAGGGATAITAGAATLSTKFAMVLAIGSVIAAGGLGGATLGSYVVEKDFMTSVPQFVLPNTDLVSYEFDTLDLAAGIAPTASPELFSDELDSLGFQPTLSHEHNLGDGVDLDRPLTLSPVSVPTTSTTDSALETPDLAPTQDIPTNAFTENPASAIKLPALAPTQGIPTISGVPAGALSGNPARPSGATQYPTLGPMLELTAPATSPGAIFSTDNPTTNVVSIPTRTSPPENSLTTIESPMISTNSKTPRDEATAVPTRSDLIWNSTTAPSDPTTVTPTVSTPTDKSLLSANPTTVGSPTTPPTAGPRSNPVATPSIGVPGPVATPSIGAPSPKATDRPSPTATASPSMTPSIHPTQTMTPTSSGTTSPPLPVGSILGWALVDESGDILMASLQEGQIISTATYGTNLKIRALHSTETGPVNSISFVIANTDGGGAATMWSTIAPFETDSSFLQYASVNIKGTPLPSSSNQGSKGIVAEINLVIDGTLV